MIEERGQLVDVGKSMSGKIRLVFEFEDFPKTAIDTLQGDLRINIQPWRESRSNNANSLLWLCLGEIAKSLRTDKWSVYLKMLRRYGKFTYIAVKPNAVSAMKKQWRECEEIGDIMIGDQPAKQLLCYFGSHTYNTEEFSVLLDGVLDEMKEMRIPMPSDKRTQKLLDEWDNYKNGKVLQYFNR